MKLRDAARLVPIALDVLDVVAMILDNADKDNLADAVVAVRAVIGSWREAAEGKLTVTQINEQLAKHVEAYDALKAGLYRELEEKFKPKKE